MDTKARGNEDLSGEEAIFGVILGQAQTCRGKYSQLYSLESARMQPLVTTLL